MQCATAAALGYDDLPSATRVCERGPDRLAPGAVFLNTLHESLPECDRATHAATLDDIDATAPASHCYVYCAQRSCHAAVGFLAEHEDALRAKCADVTYLRNGALAMREGELADGATCHAKVVAHNDVQEQGCLNCDARTTSDVDVHVDGARHEGATFLGTRSAPPDWFRRASIWSRLPPQFSRDPRYAHTPQTHDPRGAQHVRLDVTGTGIGDDALLAFWASKPADRTREAREAYGDFANGGIVQCNRKVCEFTLDPPAPYTAEGKVFRPHFHVAEWKGDHWSGVSTVTLP
jgi:hypothetical protein